MKFQGRKVVVTGGTRGIGLALCEKLVALGAHVVVVARDAKALDKLATSVGEKIIKIQADLSDRRDVDRLIETLRVDHGDLSVLINNAGSQTEMDFINGSTAQNISASRQEIALNLDAAISLSLGLLPTIAQHNAGAIANITSGLALSPKQASPTYCATKAGLRSFTTGLRYQCAAHAPDVLINEVIMALVETQMTQGRGAGKISTTQAAQEVLTGITKGRAETWVGKTKLLRVIHRLSPKVGAKLLR